MSSQLPLRIGVGIIVLNNENKIFVAKRKDNPINKWQMPQGGVEPDETSLEAMNRELYEETSIKNIVVLKEIEELLQYELPPHLVGIIWKGKYRGQKQKWFIVRFLGNDKEINLKTSHPEFIEWKWIKLEELTTNIVDFKKKLYGKLSDKIRLFIG
jgi:putative (di)nucleoside polyphosphate hydrolase|tara:strand:- start:318 stop:785 length:468 start_codon:yes stop_codon:yes gene_type:complete